MRRLATFRISSTVSSTISLDLFHQAFDNITPPATKSSILRDALTQFLADPTPAPDRNALFRDANNRPVPIPKRLTSVQLSITPPQLRAELDAYANTHNITVSSAIRRALYEYTKGNPPQDNVRPDVARLDAWGDRENPPKRT